MITVGIKDLKNQLSRYLSVVKKGEEILITDRGKVIARIVQENPSGASLTKILQPLAVQGMIRLPTRTIQRDIPGPLKISGKPVSTMVIEDRR